MKNFDKWNEAVLEKHTSIYNEAKGRQLLEAPKFMHSYSTACDQHLVWPHFKKNTILTHQRNEIKKKAYAAA